jgi:ribosomal protein S18 acetylase RimI-like enzyme
MTSGTQTTLLRLAAPRDEETLRALAWRLTAFDLPPWRRPEDIANADARDMIAAVHDGSPDNQVWLAERDGVAAGCLHVLLTTDFFGTRHAHVSVIATTAAAEGSGVGRLLMAHAEAWARERGQSLLTLNVFAANARAQRFYERAGMAPEMLRYAKRLE